MEKSKAESESKDTCLQDGCDLGQDSGAAAPLGVEMQPRPSADGPRKNREWSLRPASVRSGLGRGLCASRSPGTRCSRTRPWAGRAVLASLRLGVRLRSSPRSEKTKPPSFPIKF